MRPTEWGEEVRRLSGQRDKHCSEDESLPSTPQSYVPDRRASTQEPGPRGQEEAAGAGQQAGPGTEAGRQTHQEGRGFIFGYLERAEDGQRRVIDVGGRQTHLCSRVGKPQATGCAPPPGDRDGCRARAEDPGVHGVSLPIRQEYPGQPRGVDVRQEPPPGPDVRRSLALGRVGEHRAEGRICNNSDECLLPGQRASKSQGQAVSAEASKIAVHSVQDSTPRRVFRRRRGLEREDEGVGPAH